MRKTIMMAAGVAVIASMGAVHAKDDDMVTRSYDLGGFDEIDVAGVYELDVQVGAEFAVTLTGPDYEMERVEVSVKNDALHLSQRDWKRGDKKRNRRQGVNAVITLPSLVGLEISGVVEGVIAGVDAERFDLDLSGVGDIDIKGQCGDLDADVSGVGDLDARALECRAVDVKVSGVGDANVFASESIDAKISGMGDIDVYGSPEKIRKDSGMFSEITVH